MKLWKREETEKRAEGQSCKKHTPKNDKEQERELSRLTLRAPFFSNGLPSTTFRWKSAVLTIIRPELS